MQLNLEYELILDYKDKVKKSIIDYLKSTQNQLLIDLKVSIINQIFKNINKDDNFKNNKIYLNMPLWIKLHNKDIFRKNAVTVHNLVKDLKNKSFISKVSRDYPKNQVLFSINPLQSSFLNLRLSKFDEVKESCSCRIVCFIAANTDGTIYAICCVWNGRICSNRQ